MKQKLKSVLLVDDDEDCNYYHKRILQRMGVTDKIDIVMDGQQAIDFLKSEVDGEHPQPSIVFLDINMPVMNGWEFLQEYEKLSENQKAECVLVMLTTSLNPEDRQKADSIADIDAFENKYLSQESISNIINKHFEV